MSDNARTQISLRVPSDMLADFDRIAAVMERDRSWVILRAMKAYLEADGADVLEEAEGLAQLDRGESFELDDVLAEAEAMIAAHGDKNARKTG
ncbi:CopG family ribbon-helix-helix protein [Rhizobium sp.]